MTTYSVEMPWPRPPLSLNDRFDRHSHARLVAQIRTDVGWLVKAAHIPACDRITVQLHYAPGRRGRRDPSNLIATTKPAIDGIVDAGVVVDDDTQHVMELQPEIHFPPEPGPRCWLTIHVEDASDE